MLHAYFNPPDKQQQEIEFTMEYKDEEKIHFLGIEI